MPIRSPRGRAAAYRSIWQWPLRSPARLIITTAVALAAVSALSYGLGAARGAGATGPSGPMSSAPTAAALPSSIGTYPDTPTPPPATDLPPVAELSPEALPLSAAPPQALATVARWSAAWVRPAAGTTAARWLDGLRPFTTDEYLGVLSGVDPGNVPASRVTGEPQAVRVAPRSVQVRVPTDVVTLLVTVVETDDGGWRVAGYDRA